jgi:hypothetical protein
MKKISIGVQSIMHLSTTKIIKKLIILDIGEKHFIYLEAQS